jgi:hypothetical protein
LRFQGDLGWFRAEAAAGPAKKFDGVWWATREEIVDWYLQNHQQHIG